MEKPSHRDLDRSKYHWKHDVDYRRHPELYRVGKGEQGVLICEPYKSELVPHWRFKAPELAMASNKALYRMFLGYLRRGDFVGADGSAPLGLDHSRDALMVRRLPRPDDGARARFLP